MGGGKAGWKRRCRPRGLRERTPRVLLRMSLPSVAQAGNDAGTHTLVGLWLRVVVGAAGCFVVSCCIFTSVHPPIFNLPPFCPQHTHMAFVVLFCALRDTALGLFLIVPAAGSTPRHSSTPTQIPFPSFTLKFTSLPLPLPLPSPQAAVSRSLVVFLPHPSPPPLQVSCPTTATPKPALTTPAPVSRAVVSTAPHKRATCAPNASRTPPV